MGTSIDQKEKRRAEILAAATEVFLEKGFAGASLHEIATRAHASKETLYAWFGNKTKLFGALLEEGMKQIGERVSLEFGDGNPERVLYVIAVQVLQMINGSPLIRLFNIAAADAGRSPELREMLAARALDHGGTARYLEVCRTLGVMQFEDAHQMASIYIAMIQAEFPAKLGLGIIGRLSEEEIEQHARLVSRMFLKAVAPPR